MQGSLSVALIQSDLFWEDREKNILQFDAKIRSIDRTVDLIILPEMFSTGFSMQPARLSETMEGESVRWMKEMAAEKNCAVTGSLIIKENDNYYNRLIWFDKNGILQYYDKKHLFTLTEEHLHYTAGDKKLIIELNGWKIRPAICYDLRFPVWLRNKYDQENGYEYDLLVVTANWPQKRKTAWKTLLQARAIENQAYVAGVNRIGKDGNDFAYNGDSAVFDMLGETLSMKSDVEDISVVELNMEALQKIRTSLPFLRDDDAFTILS